MVAASPLPDRRGAVGSWDALVIASIPFTVTPRQEFCQQPTQLGVPAAPENLVDPFLDALDGRDPGRDALRSAGRIIPVAVLTPTSRGRIAMR